MDKKQIIIQFYIDGACINNGKKESIGGYSVVFKDLKNKLQIKCGHSSPATNNRMELKPFLLVLDKLLFFGNKTRTYEIFSDSAYVVNCVNGRWPYLWNRSGWKRNRIKNRDLWKQFISLDYKLKVKKINYKLCKVKGHSNIKMNELSDKYAKLAAKWGKVNGKY